MSKTGRLLRSKRTYLIVALFTLIAIFVVAITYADDNTTVYHWHAESTQYRLLTHQLPDSWENLSSSTLPPLLPCWSWLQYPPRAVFRKAFQAQRLATFHAAGLLTTLVVAGHNCRENAPQNPGPALTLGWRGATPC